MPSMSFQKNSRDVHTAWGYTFEWTSEHQTKEQMRPLTLTYDRLASECLDRLDDLAGTEGDAEKSCTPNPSPVPCSRRDLFALLEQRHATDPKLDVFWTEINTVPPWVDWVQIQRGQDVFFRYGMPCIVALTFQSLVGGMAGWRLVETLSRTGAFSTKVAKHRLLETVQHILQATHSLEAIQPGGQGFASTIRVRLLHAAVRRKILDLARDRPDYFDVDAWGVPINDLDSLGTLLSFSAAVIWMGLPRQGIHLREQEIEDFHALWRYLGYLLGTPDQWMADYRRAKVFLESLILAELEPSEMSRVLANNTLSALSYQAPAFASREFMCAEAHWLNGHKLCERLAIAKPNLWYTALVAVQCFLFMCTVRVYRAVPSWDRTNIEVSTSTISSHHSSSKLSPTDMPTWQPICPHSDPSTTYSAPARSSGTCCRTRTSAWDI